MEEAKQYIRKNAVVLGSILGVLLLLAFITYSIVSPRGIFSGLKNDLKTIEGAPEAVYTTLDGTLVELDEFKGKPLVINSWATWMPFSKEELTLLSEAKERFGDAVTILAMNRKEDAQVVRSYLSIYGIQENIILLLDQNDYFYIAVGGYAMPETLFYRKDGTLMTHKRGVLTKEELEGYLTAITEE